MEIRNLADIRNLNRLDIATIRTRLRSVLTGTLGGTSAQEAIRELAAPNPELFFDIGVSVLKSLEETPARNKAYRRLLESEEFLIELIRPGRYSDQELRSLCASWVKIDSLLDLRLARLMPGRDGDPAGLPPEQMARLLGLLHHISVGPRLILLTNHLKHHPDPLVAEKATVLVGRRIRNAEWVKRQLASSDARIRAAAVEGLWGSNTPSARAAFEQSRNDEDSCVVANALLGLHFLGETGVGRWVTEMACDQRSAFRRRAVWAMGRIGAAEFLEPLRAALADPEAEVRLGAKQALAAMRKVGVETRPVKAPATAAKIEPEAPAPVETQPEVEEFRFRFDGSYRPGDQFEQVEE